LVNKDVLDLAYNPEIVHKVQSLLGEDITLSNALSFIKKPHTGVTTKWHNAPPSTFGGVYDREDEGINQVTVWISLSDTKQDNGAMKIVPRSFLGDIMEDIVVSRHHFDKEKEYLDIDQKFLYQRAAKDSRYRQSGSIMGTPNQYFDLSQNIMGIGLREGYIREIIEKHKMNAYKLEAEPGEFYMFSSRNIHCAFPNSSDRTRVAIAFRYLSNSNMRGVRPINESPSFEKAKEHPIFKMILDGLGISSQRQEPLLVLCAGKAQAQLEKFYIDIENIRAQQSKVEQKWSPDLRQ
jgi:ectoine hydroxylase-related dioxygenase (phytanoyl-CoA dioxygenase family)